MNLMPILFYISQVLGQKKFDTSSSKSWRKKMQRIKTPKRFQYKETSCLGT